MNSAFPSLTNIQPIANDTDYAAALARVSPLVDLDPAPDTPEFDELKCSPR